MHSKKIAQSVAKKNAIHIVRAGFDFNGTVEG